ncbi:MAG: methyl-accepting chemotaxis protein [Candidatus Kariarchaeaceae archaeon]
MNSKIKWHHWLQIILPVFILYLLISLSITKEKFYGLGLVNWISFFLIPLSFVIVFAIIVIKAIGVNDFRFKVFLNMALFGTSTATFGVMIPEMGILELFSSDRTRSLSDIFLKLVLFAGPLGLIIAGSLFSIFALFNPFMNEVENLSGKVKNGDLTAQLENPVIMNDSVFGPISVFMNEIVETSSNLFKDIAHTSQLIAKSSVELSSSAEEVNASAEEVSSTSQSMSNGATQQSEMITDIVMQMGEADKVINAIIAQIQKNTEAVSQIALQTNILALNAGIEASRAGDYGRGFAVVAENVRKLSDESKLSANDISDVVETISTTLKELFNRIQDNIENVASVSEETAASAEEVAAAAEEMTSSMEEVSLLSQNLSNEVEKSRKLINNQEFDDN